MLCTQGTMPIAHCRPTYLLDVAVHALVGLLGPLLLLADHLDRVRRAVLLRLSRLAALHLLDPLLQVHCGSWAAEKGEEEVERLLQGKDNDNESPMGRHQQHTLGLLRLHLLPVPVRQLLLGVLLQPLEVRRVLRLRLLQLLALPSQPRLRILLVT